MVTCPACKSSKLYQGYRRPSFLARALRLHEYLCEQCNLQFQAFALRSPRRKRRRMRPHDAQYVMPLTSHLVQQSASTPAAGTTPPPDTGEAPAINPVPAIKPAKAASPPRAADVAISARKPVLPEQSQPAPPPKPPSAPTLTLSDLQGHAERREHHRSRHLCPQCGAMDTERRRRRLWERVVFAFSDIRAYNCRICGHSFYARRKYKSSK